MNFIQIDSIEDPRVRHYMSLTDSVLKADSVVERGVFIAESPKVIESALDAGMKPLSLLCEEKHIEGDAASIIERLPKETPVYSGSRQVLASLTGYTLTRGVLCAMERPELPSVSDILKKATRIAVIDGVCDTTNIGSIFRAAAALGIDGILLTPTSCSPLHRRSIRVSMGTVFRIPWNWIQQPLSTLRNFGFKTLAMALKKDSLPLDHPGLAEENKLAIILGTEGDGLKDMTIADADFSVIIPMHHGVDSLNVAAAAAVAFWQLRPRKLNQRSV